MNHAMTFTTQFATGDHVFYADNGPGDTGVVTEVRLMGEAVHYAVAWDDGSDADLYTAGQLRFA